jgi:hypothetical protein
MTASGCGDEDCRLEKAFRQDGFGRGIGLFAAGIGQPFGFGSKG